MTDKDKLIIESLRKGKLDESIVIDKFNEEDINEFFEIYDLYEEKYGYWSGIVESRKEDLDGSFVPWINLTNINEKITFMGIMLKEEIDSYTTVKDENNNFYDDIDLEEISLYNRKEKWINKCLS